MSSPRCRHCQNKEPADLRRRISSNGQSTARPGPRESSRARLFAREYNQQSNRSSGEEYGAKVLGRKRGADFKHQIPNKTPNSNLPGGDLTLQRVAVQRACASRFVVAPKPSQRLRQNRRAVFAAVRAFTENELVIVGHEFERGG